MKKFLSVYYKVSLKKLFIGEHFAFYESLINTLEPIAGNINTVEDLFNALKIAFNREDALFKQSLASLLTSDIVKFHTKRLAYFLFFWKCVDLCEQEDAADVKEAVRTLKFLHKTYEKIPSENYFDMSGTMTNFLQDCASPTYLPSIQLLSTGRPFDLTVVLSVIGGSNTSFKAIYQNRAISNEHIAQLGNLSEIRYEVDTAFSGVIDSINVAWASNELVAKDPALRQKLLEAKEVIIADIHQIELNLSRRGHHLTASPTQTPDISNPAAPDTPPQTPGNNTPPTIDPDELNPPAVGER